ncbi:MAG: hypothetical protein SGPRY_007381 [Prymnesium sp.]
MQVDVGTLKQTLLDLPSLGQVRLPEGSAVRAQAMATMSYNKLVAHEVGKAEQADLGGVLKLVQTPEELLEATIKEMRSTGFEPDLHKILELKGTPREHSIGVLAHTHSTRSW